MAKKHNYEPHPIDPYSLDRALLEELYAEIARLRTALQYKGQKRDRKTYMRDYQRARRAKLKNFYQQGLRQGLSGSDLSNFVEDRFTFAKKRAKAIELAKKAD